MKKNQIAAQLYTLREQLKSKEAVVSTLGRVKAIGYEAVQVSGVGDFSYRELARILDGEGLVCCATHEDSDLIRAEPEKVVERLSILGCSETAYPYPRNVEFGDPEAVNALIDDLDRSGAFLRKAGIRLSYHNHAVEFLRYRDATILDFIYGQIPAKNLSAELDTYWIQVGGGNPVTWCSKMNGRLPCIHLKDYAVSQDGKSGDFAEVGYGNLEWPAILDAAEGAGCQWFIVEQDICRGDPFDSLKMSFEFLVRMVQP